MYPTICLLLSSKFDELDDNIPLIRELQKILAPKVIYYDDVLKAENDVLQKLNWDLFKLTPLHFVQNLIGQGVVYSNDRLSNGKEVDDRVLKSVKKHAEFFADLLIQDYNLSISFRPSVLGIACIVCARRVNRITPEWNSLGLGELTDYEYEGEVKKCTEKLYKLYLTQLAPSLKQSADCKFSNKEN